jgi:protein phosphatase
MLLDRVSDRLPESTARCQRYLWALGDLAAKIPTGQTIADRYQVIAPRIWLDTQPDRPPRFPTSIPEELSPYLQLYPWRLHLPEAFGACQWAQPEDSPEILLLENAPIDRQGNLYPVMTEVWAAATPVRQVYWLWQLLQLWTPLSEAGVAASLLDDNNIRVEGWRVWLLELKPSALNHTLKDLGQFWSNWIDRTQETIAEPLKQICQKMRSGDITLEDIATHLDALLLDLAARQPLRVQVAGATDAGPVRPQNEDACYPTPADLQAKEESPHKELLSHVAIVCDGVGGHEGGEIASHMTVQALKLQLRAFLTEIAQESTIVPQALISEQLAAIVRVVNNMVAAQNDSQDRESRQRMGTTLAMGLQLPQKVQISTGETLENAHELYVVNIGDSRAYWLTRDYCQRLTVDDDVAGREVRLGRSLYRQAQERYDAAALTKALGTRDSQMLHPTIDRFILEEDGLLLLCSDGLSDNDWVEQSWREFAPGVLDGERTLQETVEAWVQLANEKNGHDNASVVLTYYRVSELTAKEVQLFDPAQKAKALDTPDTPMSESSKALLYGQPSTGLDPYPSRRRDRSSYWMTILGIVGALALSVAMGWLAMSQLKTRQAPSVPEPEVQTAPELPPSPTTEPQSE